VLGRALEEEAKLLEQAAERLGGLAAPPATGVKPAEKPS
jgi:hypothetical protein